MKKMETYLWIWSIVFFAGFTQGVSGFGSVLLALPFLAIFLDIKTVIPLVALFGLSITLVLFIQLRKYLEWKKIYPLVVGAILGIPFGVFFLKRFDSDVIHWTLGIFLVFYSSYKLFYTLPERGIREGWAYLSGFFAGCLGGALGAAGPPVIVYTSLQPWTKDTIKVTLQGFFVVCDLMVVIAQAASGVTTVSVLKFFMISLPALVLGTYSGSYFYGMIKEEWYKRILLILLAFLGIFMIYKTV